MPSKRKPTRSPVFYGWYILAASFGILFLTTGARFTIGVVFKPLMAEFGWDRGLVSLAFFLNMATFAVSLTFVGRAYDRYGPKWVIIISTLLISAGFMGLAFIHSFWQFFIFYGFISALGMGGTTVPLFAALLSKWFEKGRGVTVSLGLTGSCMGQFILVPLFTSFTSTYGWRLSYLSLGAAMLIFITTVTFWVIKGDPHELGLKPWGQKQGERDSATGDPEHKDHQIGDMGLREAMRTYSFWLFLVLMFICGSGDFMVTTHLIPMVTDYGISPTVAGNMLAWLGLMSLGGILIAGPISDAIGNKAPFSITFLVRFFLFLLILKYQSLVSFYVFSCGFGLTLLVTAPLNAILVGRLYGFSHVGLISGFITTVHHLGGGFWAYTAGEIFDHTNSYHIAFVFMAAMAIMATFCALFIKEKPHHP
jgi:MFS family permease